MQKIKCFRLKNSGLFVCKGKIQYIDSNGHKEISASAGPIDIGQSEWVDPAKLGVPSDVFGQLYIDIVWGDDRTGGTYFLFDASSTVYADYEITGTTLHSAVHFHGIKPLN